MTREEKLKLLLDTGEYDFIKYIPKENMWKLIFALTYIEDTIPMSDIDGIKAELLEQEDILDKIRAEIKQMDFDFGDYYDHTNTIIEMVLAVIDKYRAESEDKK